MAKTLILNGSLGGATGNTGLLIHHLKSKLESNSDSCDVIHLASEESRSKLTRAFLSSFDAYVFATGTYWDSWGSPLQKFLEDQTSLEGDDAWAGKPAAVLVTMHSVGGKSISSRLQGVLNSFGLFIPPMAAMVYSLANQEALTTGGDHEADLWCVEDLDVLAHNLKIAAHQKSLNYICWPVDRSDPRRVWLKLRHETTT